MSFLDGMIGIKQVTADGADPVPTRDTLHVAGDGIVLTDDPDAQETVLSFGSSGSTPSATITTDPPLDDDVTLFDPAGFDGADLVRIITAAEDAISIHGAAEPSVTGDPRKTLVFANGSGFDIVLKHLSSTATAHARFSCPLGVDYVLAQYSSIDMLYDATSHLWRLLP